MRLRLDIVGISIFLLIALGVFVGGLISYIGSSKPPFEGPESRDKISHPPLSREGDIPKGRFTGVSLDGREEMAPDKRPAPPEEVAGEARGTADEKPEGREAEIVVEELVSEEAEGRPESPEEIEEEIRSVIFDRFVAGYVEGDIERYISAFWEEGFLYRSSQGTDDPSDDVEITDLDVERRAASKIFQTFPLISFEVSILEIQIDEDDPNRATVRFRYSMRAESEDRGLSCEGEGIFIMERRSHQGREEWRIKEWYDHQFTM